MTTVAFSGERSWLTPLATMRRASRVGLVEDGEGGVEHSHLEDFVLLLLAAAEAFVDRAVGKVGGHFDNLFLFFHEFEELGTGEGVETAVFALLIDSGTHEVGDGHARYFDGILEAKENAFVGAHVDGEIEDVLSVVNDFAFGHGIFRVACNDACKGTFSVAVRAHDGVDLAFVYFKIYAFQNLAVADAGVQIADG